MDKLKKDVDDVAEMAKQLALNQEKERQQQEALKKMKEKEEKAAAKRDADDAEMRRQE